MAKFKIGDRVRVASRKIAAEFGEEFTVTNVVEDTWRRNSYSSEALEQIKSERGDRWYKGDKRHNGVLENYLEIVEES